MLETLLGKNAVAKIKKKKQKELRVSYHHIEHNRTSDLLNEITENGRKTLRLSEEVTAIATIFNNVRRWVVRRVSPQLSNEEIVERLTKENPKIRIPKA